MKYQTIRAGTLMVVTKNNIMQKAKDFIIKYWKLFLKHWYAIGLTIVALLISFEILGTWAGYGYVFLCVFGLVLKNILKGW